jgi:hypothetical protein
MKNWIYFILVIAITGLALGSSGCTSSGQSNEGVKYAYHNQTEVPSGLINVSADIPIRMYQEGGNYPEPQSDSMPENVWIGVTEEEEGAIHYAFFAKVNSTDKLDLDVGFPSGARAFISGLQEVPAMDGTYNVTASHQGFSLLLFDYKGSGVQPLYPGEGYTKDWDNESAVPIGGKTLMHQRINILVRGETGL